MVLDFDLKIIESFFDINFFTMYMLLYSNYQIYTIYQGFSRFVHRIKYYNIIRSFALDAALSNLQFIGEWQTKQVLTHNEEILYLKLFGFVGWLTTAPFERNLIVEKGIKVHASCFRIYDLKMWWKRKFGSKVKNLYWFLIEK